MHSSLAPLEIGRVTLTVNDLGKLSAFYQRALGLAPMGGDGETALLGAGNRVLLELRGNKAARRRSPREAGLFHTAFLLPDRADLGAWLRYAADSRLPLEGASDHSVSEAIYLSDPEGNGIEVYIDRPRSAWKVRGTEIHMTSDGLDLDALVRSAKAPWGSAPEGTVVGHVHLQVGTLPEAEAFYTGKLGFDLTCRYPGANFYGAGGYHHHLATNTWNSRGAGPRALPSTGLTGVEILADRTALAAASLRNAGQTELADPWGTRFTLTAKEG